MTLTRSKTAYKPICFYCHIDLDNEQTARAAGPPVMALPAGVGVIICTPACPELPDGTKAYRHPQWRNA